jgi:hypothetical protein
MTQSRLSKRKAPLQRTLHVHDYLVSSSLKAEPPTLKWYAHLLNETCLKEQDANFWYDFRNDRASQRASNLLEFLSALRAFALRLVNFHQLSTSEHLFPGGFGKQRTACTLR